jgi:tetratricopeptide (TPR) repeat protein
MRRWWLLATGVAVLGALLASSIVRVPAGGAFCGGRFLEPGVRLRAPLALVNPYPTGDQLVTFEPTMTSREGASQKLTIDLVFRWSTERLHREPLPPDVLASHISTDLLNAHDGRHPAPELGRAIRAALPDLLAALPITVVRAEVRYPGEAVEALRATARPTGRRLILVGLDGLDWGLLDRLIAAGRCPTLARLKREGAWADLVSHQPVLSPLIWTSMGTGRRPEEHGILDFVVSDPATGKDVPITSQFRKVHAFWNILSFLGRRVDVVNWWATYPAEPVNGVLVSERMFYQLFGIRPSLDDPATVFPPKRLGEIRLLVTGADEIGYDEIRRYCDISRADFEARIAAARTAENPFDDPVNHLRQMIAVTRSVFTIARQLAERQPADVLAVYIEGTDTVGHRFAHFMPPRLPWVAVADVRRFGGAMARFYELCDRDLGELLRVVPADTTVIVTADHGFFTDAARPSAPPDDFGSGAAQWHRMTGVFLAAGPDVRRGRLAHADISDLCRTVLWLQGAPISRQLQGRELTELVEPAWVAANPPRFVDSYEDLPHTWILPAAQASTAGRLIDETRLKELESLGYISPGGESAARVTLQTGPTPGPPAAPALQTKATEPYNLGKLAVERGDLAAAERHFLAAIEAYPGFAVAMSNLANVESQLGRHDEALRWYMRALELEDSELPASVLGEFVRAMQAAGRIDRALPALDVLRPRWGATASFDAARGVALVALRRPTEAEQAFLAALAQDPADAEATSGLLSVVGPASVVAEQALERHFHAVEGDLKRLNTFAVVCLQNRRPDWAERALRQVLASDPRNPGVMSNLAAALQLQGKSEEATEVLERAVAARPNDASLRFNYGAVLAALGRDQEALAQFEAAERLAPPGARLFAAKAKVLFRLGRVGEAQATLEDGARRFPDSAEIRELLATLQGYR